MAVMIIDSHLCDLCNERSDILCVKGCSAHILGIQGGDLQVLKARLLRVQDGKRFLDSPSCQGCRYCRTECPVQAVRFR